ncbi:hypothetical protein EVAR_94059_1 [Eumeta japonica]|uniref:Uncharacterized protein n=1 Tax=Eumeta variegata TaxID=151549 RepID=A0A4C1V6L2_EUMVA|nr:hypothetical protein EVAR_94059_1 [Eumeta japonica]
MVTPSMDTRNPKGVTAYRGINKHERSHLQRSHQCVAGLFGRNRISDRELLHSGRLRGARRVARYEIALSNRRKVAHYPSGFKPEKLKYSYLKCANAE